MSNFGEYVRSASFTLNLSKNMISVLLCLYHSKEPPGNLVMTPYFGLKRRGLIEWNIIDGKKDGPFITEAGVLICKLLELAEFK